MKKLITTIALIFVLGVVLTGSVSAIGALWAKEQLTNTGSNSNIDIAMDSSDIAHRVYERSGSIYYSNSDCDSKESFVGLGTNPAIAVGPDKKPQIVFLQEGKWVYAVQNGASWNTESYGTNVDVVDIAVDKNNKAHITYSANDDNDAYYEIYYTNNVGGAFSSPLMVADGSFGYGSGAYFHNPSIKVDIDGYYHIAMHSQSWQGNAKDSADYAIVLTNAATGGGNSPDFAYNAVGVGKDSVGIDSNGKVLMVYNVGSSIYLGTIVGNTWNQKLIGTGSNPTIDVRGDKVDVVYVDSLDNIKYMEATIPSNYPTTDILFDTPSTLDTGSYPVVGIGSRVVDYVQNSQVIEASTDRHLTCGTGGSDGGAGGSGNGTIPIFGPATVTGTITYDGSAPVDQASVDVICEHNGTNSSLHDTTNIAGQYFVVYDRMDCDYGDNVWVSAAKGDQTGQGSGTMCSEDTCELLPVALVNVTIPEFGVIAGAVALIGAVGIIAYRRRK